MPGYMIGIEPKEADSLQTHIAWYTNNGYVVESQTETDALLVNPKGEFSVGWAIFWFVVPPLFLWLICYLVYHVFIKRKRVVDLFVEDGKVKRR